MKVILKAAVEHVGEKGTVVEVRKGFARNFLLARGLAEMASPGNLAQLELRRAAAERKSQVRVDQAQSLAQRISSMELTLSCQAGAGDKLHGAVTAQDIAQALAQKGLVVDKHAIALEAPIHKLGRFTVPIRLHSNVEASLKLWVLKA